MGQSEQHIVEHKLNTNIETQRVEHARNIEVFSAKRLNLLRKSEK